MAFLCRLTGARPSELRAVLGCFAALFFLLVSYYFVKPLRNGQFLKEFPPTMLPVFYICVSMFSLAVTKLFNFLFQKLTRRTLILSTFSTMIALALVFTVWLPMGGKPATVVFYLWASVYFLLVLAALWACINDTFQPEQGERVYGFIAIGASLGNIVGSKLSALVADSALRPYALLFAAGGMAAAVALILGTYRPVSASKPDAPEPNQPKAAFWDDLKVLFTDRYLRALAIMVTTLAMFNSSADFLTQKIIDQRVSKSVYVQRFGENMPAEGFAFIYGLKSLSAREREAMLFKYSFDHDLDNAQLGATYARYSDEVAGKTTKLFSDVFFYQGVLGVGLLLLASRWRFQAVGLQISASILPTYALFGLVAMALPLSLWAVQAFLILSGALNYSLNNACKELLYTATSTEAKFQQKPLIEGPCMRAGDNIASILNLFPPRIAAALGLSAALGENFFLIVCFFAVLAWLHEINFAGKMYDRRRRTPRPADSP